jgi:NAD(P)-dependent dehydrogenase (short-subunit alcohol dehydrogenase family)
MTNLWSYAGKRVAIAGCATGMGEACARTLVAVGAEVHGVDIKASPVALASFTQVDLKDWDSIDAAVAGIGGDIDALFNCAGLPQTFPALDVLAVNFLGIRHWTEQWLPCIARGGAIATVSSLAGLRYLQRLPLLKEVILLGDRATTMRWAEAHPETLGDGYSFSKELLNTWTQMLAVELAPRGIRANATLPSPTETPMIAAFEKLAGEERLKAFCAPTGRRSTAQEQANALILLNSAAAGFISGVCLAVDGGYLGGMNVGTLDAQPLLANARTGIK